MADTIGWALLKASIQFQIHYLDDNLFFVPPQLALESYRVQAQVVDTLSQLGVPIALNKVEGPAMVVTFLGIVVDMVRRELRLPLEYIRGLVRERRGQRFCMLRSFQSLLGHLSHAATVVRQGHIFLCHLFVLLASGPHGKG